MPGCVVLVETGECRAGDKVTGTGGHADPAGGIRVRVAQPASLCKHEAAYITTVYGSKVNGYWTFEDVLSIVADPDIDLRQVSREVLYIHLSLIQSL